MGGFGRPARFCGDMKMEYMKGQDNTGADMALDGKIYPSSMPITKPSVHAPGAATKATTTVAAGGAGIRHVCAGITASLACGATAQTPITINLLDGATVIWSAVVSAPANGSVVIPLIGLAKQGSPNTAMTLEFSAAGVAASLEAVTLDYYDIKDA